MAAGAGDPGPARRALAALGSARPALRVAVAAADAARAERGAAPRPDVLLVDLGDQRGSDALREIGTAPGAPAVVVFAARPRAALVAEVAGRGAGAVLRRDATAEVIVAAVDAALAGLVALHPDALAPAPRRPPEPRASAPLTPREAEVLAMVAEGLGNKVIAARLGISRRTVRFHVAEIFAKLEAGSRTEAVTIGIRRGLVMI